MPYTLPSATRNAQRRAATSAHVMTRTTTAMIKVTQHLWFAKDMDAALHFYTSLIPGSSIGWISAIPADNPSGPAGSVKIAAFTIGDQRYMAIEAGRSTRSTTASRLGSSAIARPRLIAFGMR